MTKTKTKWDQFAIKAEVHRRGLTLTGIARQANLYEGACRQGLLGNSQKGAQAIANALNVPFRELFPTQYASGRHNGNDGRRNKQRDQFEKSSAVAGSGAA